MRRMTRGPRAHARLKQRPTPEFAPLHIYIGHEIALILETTIYHNFKFAPFALDKPRLCEWQQKQ